MTKFSGIATNTSPADSDYVVGVTIGNVDSRFSFATILAWLKAKTAWITASNIDFTSYTHLRATLSGSYSAPANNSVITLNQTDYDNLSEFNTSTHLFTAKSAGKYQIIARYWWGSAGCGTTENTEAQIWKNGTAVLASGRENGSGDGNRLLRPLVNGTVVMAAGDTLGLYFTGSSGIRDISSGVHTYLEVHRVG